MIFATVGTQLPFPRLLGWLDGIAAATGAEVVAQTGRDGTFYPHLTVRPWLDGPTFSTFVGDADRVVAHAGIGSLLKAMRAHKPVILVPRLARLGEHRNDHQIATARHFAETPGVYVAEDRETLALLMAEPVLKAPVADAPSDRQEALIDNLRQTFAAWS